LEGAVLHDAEFAAKRVVSMIAEGAVIAVSGQRLPVGIDSVCVHGDNPNAVAMAKTVRAHLEAAGIVVKPFVAH